MTADRQYAVSSLIFDYVKSPSLRHLKDSHSVHKLTRDIVNAIDRKSAVWTKWETDREEIAKAAAWCWLPIDDLLAFLNGLPGAPLTTTDVVQRLRALQEEPYTNCPDDELQDGAQALYRSEKEQGTEMRAIIGAFQEYLERENDRLQQERQDAYRRQRDDERKILEQNFLAGADCGWTKIGGSEALFCRRNGRMFRITQGKDKRWTLFRVNGVDDGGDRLGVYQGRGDANTALKKIAYAK